ncbi:MAG: ATP-binding protein [Deltaproteobacteria bacterium]|nr:ATP-binding protein [Deltaproteobacteria bacterium]MBW2354916.1 ATP-binding protein [Deltaproteobacteria bacterium]
MINKIRKETLLTVVAEWLEEGEIPSLVARNQHTIDPENLHRILAVVGPRRAGKTYFMYQIIKSLLQSGRHEKEDILFIDFEDYRLGGFSGDDMDELFAAFHQLAGRYPRFLFFDEVQNLPDWNRVLRTLHNRRRFKIIVSGSNSKLLGREIATELRGRYDDFLMLPFSFREYLQYRGISFTPASLHTAARGNIMAAFDDYLLRGGFPEVVMAGKEPEQRRLLQSYFKTIFYRDILERYHVKARYVLDALMNDFLETYSSVFSITRFEKHLKGNGLPGSKRTIANYLHYLQEAFFIIANEKFSFSLRRRIMNPKKIYLTDTGFAALGRPFAENRGRILENTVAIELFRRGLELYYFKDKKECDFIVKAGTRPTHAIQVCWELTRLNEKRETAGLKSAFKSLDLPAGIILTYAQEEEREISGRRISVLPVWKWLLTDNINTISSV